MRLLKPFLVWLFFSILFTSVYAEVTQRQIKFTNFKINNLYSSTANSGTITIPYTATNKSVSRIDATVLYEQPAGHTDLNYIIDLEVIGASGTTLYEQAAIIGESELFNSNEISRGFSYEDVSKTDFPIKIKAKIYWRDDPNNTNGNGIWYFASTGEFTINLESDPNAIANNFICRNSNTSQCDNSEFKQVTDVIQNITLYGSTPQKGGTGGNNAGTYFYQWEIKYDNDAWENIPSATSLNYLLSSTTAYVTHLRRKVTTVNFPNPSYSNTITLRRVLCDQPAEGICADQYYYNCTPGAQYMTQVVQGSHLWEWDADVHKVIWQLQERGHDYDDHSQSQTYSEFIEKDYGTFTKKADRPTDVYYARRRIEWRNCTWGVCGDWHTKTESNEIRLVFSSCADPNTFTHTLTGPTQAKCTDVSLHYDLVLSTDCGIDQVLWSAPAGWTFLTPSSGQSIRSADIKPFNGSNVASGYVRVRVIYTDGKVFDRSIYVTGQAAPVLTETPHNWPIRICDGQASVFTVTGSGGLAPYTCEWYGNNLNFTPTVSGNTYTAVINPVQTGGTHSIKGVIVDANGCKATSNTVEVNDGTDHWMSGTPWGVGTNLPVADINWIENYPYVETTDAHLESENRGNIYYIARVDDGQFKLATVQWDNAGSQWRNFTFPKVNAPSVSSGSLGIRELTPGNRTIYYVGLDKKIHSISSINGYQNEFTVTNNWTNEVIYPNTQDVKYIMCVDKNYVVYKNYAQQVYAMANNGSVILVDGSAVEGNHAAISGGNIFYVKNGGLFCKSITTIYQTAIISKEPGLTRVALPHTDIEIYGNYLYFTGADRHIKRVNLTPGTVYYLTRTADPLDPTSITCNGFFSINKNTGVIYFVGDITKTTMNQLFYNSVLGWKTKQIGNEEQAGSVSYTTPNAFYVDYFGRIKFTFFYMNVCNPSIVRTSGTLAQNEDQIEGLGTPPVNYGEVNVVMYPNPTSRELNITVEGAIPEELSYVLTDLSGKEIGRYTNSYIDLGERAPGIYLLSVYQNEMLLKVEKIVVK